MRRLTLRTLLAYAHGLLSHEEQASIERRVAESPLAGELLGRLAAGPGADDAADDRELEDANTVAEYLDHVLGPLEVDMFESRSFASQRQLAEVVAVHGILAWVLTRPAELAHSQRDALLKLGGPADEMLPDPVADSELLQPPVVEPTAAEPASLLVPVGIPTPALVELSEATADGPRGRFYARSWTMSLAAHAALLIVLGLWLLPMHGASRAVIISSSFALPESLDPEKLDSFAVATPVRAVGNLSGVTRSVGTPDSYAATSKPELDERVVLAASPLALEPATRRALGPLAAERLDAEVRLTRSPTAAAGGGVRAAGGVAEAVDGILGGIRGEVEQGDLLVVWLLDASLSLADDRRQISERIEPFYREIDGRKAATSHLLMSAAVAYGGGVAELVGPTRFGGKMIDAVLKVPIDQTGLENVMTAVQWCVRKYRHPRRGLMIVVWTDESGDDVAALESTIEMCRATSTTVSVVGPSAMLGSERGTHRYTDRTTGFSFLLPIKRGPDTCLPEKPLLPYWHDSSLPPWSRSGAVVDQSTPWFGGVYREGLLSGFGPYALTRLALQTGGRFTLLDRPGTGGPFRFEAMQPYLPDYGSVAEYRDSLKYSRLRQAVSATAMLTYQQTVAPPTLSFVSERDPFYPFGIINFYMTAGEFRTELRAALAQEKARMQLSAELVEQALAPFGVAGLEAEYQREPSPRWRAWYDLCRGRLLALSLRHAEYARVCDMIFAQAGFLGPQTNHLRLHPAASPKTLNSTMAARESEALRLLRRCVERNPETPWAYLAQWELDRPWGLQVEQIVIPPPRPSGPAPPRPAMPSLPNL